MQKILLVTALVGSCTQYNQNNHHEHNVEKKPVEKSISVEQEKEETPRLIPYDSLSKENQKYITKTWAEITQSLKIAGEQYFADNYIDFPVEGNLFYFTDSKTTTDSINREHFFKAYDNIFSLSNRQAIEKIIAKDLDIIVKSDNVIVAFYANIGIGENDQNGIGETGLRYYFTRKNNKFKLKGLLING